MKSRTPSRWRSRPLSRKSNSGLALLATMLVLPSLVTCAAATEPAGVTIPGDSIEVVFKWGKNSVDTVAGKLTKDLIDDGTVTADFVLAAADRQSILAAADSMGFFGFPQHLGEIDAARGGAMTHPCERFRLTITAGDDSSTVLWNTCSYLPTDQWRSAMRLGMRIERIVRESATYQALPRPKGSYL